MRMHRFMLALSCILTMLTAPISAQDLQKGLEAYRSSDYKTALKEWKPLAERGNSKAQYWLGVLYGLVKVFIRIIRRRQNGTS